MKSKNSKIFVAGGQSGLVGTALVRELIRQGYKKIITRTRDQLDLLDNSQVESFFSSEKPDYVFLAAAKVGGILANQKFKADFILDNLTIQNNVISAAWKHDVSKLLFLGSSCIYPKLCPQPIKEEYLLTGPLEQTNDAYAIAKIAGIKMCQSFNQQYGTNFISVMPTNLYGINDNFDLNTSHVLPAFIRKFDDAKRNKDAAVTLWGTGSPRREFLHVDDLATAAIHLMNHYNSSEILNIGCGEDVTIKELANIVKEVVGYKGKIIWDSSKPDGSPKKLLDISKLKALGWKPQIPLVAGITSTYGWYSANYHE